MNLQKRVMAHYDKLNESDLYIWHYICGHREKCIQLTIEQLARECHVSKSTVLRFAQKLDLSGYSEFKYYLKNEPEHMQFEAGKQVDISLMFDSYSRMLMELQNKNYHSFCEMIHNASRIFVVPSGTVQASVAKELARQFLKLQVIMTVIAGHSEIKMLEQVIKEQDVLILISLTGETPEILDLMRSAKTVGTKTVSITQISANSMSRLATEAIYIYSGEMLKLLDAPYLSPTMYFAVTELLFAQYYNYRLDLKP